MRRLLQIAGDVLLYLYVVGAGFALLYIVDLASGGGR